MDYDAIVVGSGAGGGVAAGELARAGRKVLVVERGAPAVDPARGRSERHMILEQAGGDDRTVVLNGRPERLAVGGVAGGSTALFGAALLRPGRCDLEPGRSYAAHLPRHLWEWPVDYDELVPHLDRAEDIFCVAGDHREAPPHLGRRLRPYPGELPPLEPAARRIRDAARRQGLRPFRLPLAIDFRRCARCGACPGFVCPTGARASSLSAGLADARARGRLELWTRCEAVSLQVERGRARGLLVRERTTGRRHRVSAEVYLLAAGALGTPVLLQRSGLGGRSGERGRNHMAHLGALAVGVFRRPTGAAERFAKQVGLTDFYRGTPELPTKMGYAQMVPIPGPLSVAEHAPVPLPRAVARGLHTRSLLLAGAVEDLPDPANRVRVDLHGGIRLMRRFGRFDRMRARALARRLAGLLREAGALVAFSHVAHAAHRHLAHQVGTCRFGRDPATSVLDPQCRVHGHEDVYVVDGSFMPTSLGVGPALTIAANALRVSAHVLKEAL